MKPDLAHLGKGSLTLAPIADWPTTKILRLVTEGLTVGIAVEGDVDLKKALDRLLKQIAEAEKETQRIEGKLKSADFVANAPPAVITEHQERVRSLTRDRAMLMSSEQQLRAMLGA
jgi:valyl-tRNA synthetase